jgi:hypothetical protein
MGPKTSLSTLLPNALNKPSPQFLKHQVSDTHKNTGLISVLHSMTSAFLPNRPKLECFSNPKHLFMIIAFLIPFQYNYI